MDNNDYIPILYATDTKGVNLLVVSMLSIFKKAKTTTKFHFHIFHKNINDKIIQTVIDKFKLINPNHKFTFIDCASFDNEYNISIIQEPTALFGKKGASAIWPTPSYYYFFADKLIKDYEKILYLDIDTIACCDLSEVYNLEIKKTFLGARDNHFAQYFTSRNLEWANNKNKKYKQIDQYFPEFLSENVTKYTNYMNSGVILFNKKQMWELINDYHKFFNFTREHHFDDQSQLNWYFNEQITIMPIWNNFCLYDFSEVNKRTDLSCLMHNEKNTVEQIANCEKYVKIIHYTGYKPWEKGFIYDNVDLIQKFNNFDDFINFLFTSTLDQIKNKFIDSSLITKYMAMKKSIDHAKFNTPKTKVYQKALAVWVRYWCEINDIFNKEKFNDSVLAQLRHLTIL